MILIALSQSYTVAQTEYCLPIEKARLLIQDAIARKSLDSMVVELNGKIDLLESDKITSAQNFNALLAIERDRTQIEKEIGLQQKAISGTYQDEVKHLKKKVRSRTWQRNGAEGIALLVIVIVLSVTN